MASLSPAYEQVEIEIENNSFEGGHYKWGIQQNVPDGFDFWSAGPDDPSNWVDPAPHSRFAIPEVQIASKNNLPPFEHGTLIVHGKQSVKVFKARQSWYVRLYRWVTLPPGDYLFYVPVFGDFYTGNNPDGSKIPAPDPKTGQVKLHFNRQGVGHWRSMTPYLEYVEHLFYFNWGGGAVDLGVELLGAHPVKNAGIFTDYWRLFREGEPDPDPCVCLGDFRDPTMERKYVVVPRSLGEEWRRAVGAGSMPKGLTSGESPDDAGGGNLPANQKEPIVIFPELIGTGLTQAWFDEYYPGVKMSAIRPKDPADLIQILSTWGDAPDPTPQTPFTLACGHWQAGFNGWLGVIEKFADAGIPQKWAKLVDTGAENAGAVLDASGGQTQVVFRHVDDQLGKYKAMKKPDGSPDYLGAAYAFWNTHANAVKSNPITGVESLNEMYATHDLAGIEWGVGFDVAFCEVVTNETGGDVIPFVLTAPPGNPDHGAETQMLIPAVEAAIRTGGRVAPHTYYTATSEHIAGCGDPVQRTWDWLRNEGLHYHLRPLLSWDFEFDKVGLKPIYWFGEWNAVAAWTYPDNCRPAGFKGSGPGWRHPECLNGDLDLFLDHTFFYEDQISEWNAANDGRCEGYSIFTSGRVKWGDFQYNKVEWAAYQARRIARISRWREIERVTVNEKQECAIELLATIMFGLDLDNVDSCYQQRQDLKAVLGLPQLMEVSRLDFKDTLKRLFSKDW